MISQPRPHDIICRYRSRPGDRRRDRRHQTSVRHLGSDGEHGEPDGEHRSQREDPGEDASLQVCLQVCNMVITELLPHQVPESTSCILVERGFLRQLRGNIYVKGISERHGKVTHMLMMCWRT